ncbi:hypothetical protein [Psychroflexus sp. MES1-P1E]|uniref:hypothetical protein n=1 Tax=Psychroflexus sp. MES1-P1E TaxID=2058320 RepID=UPI000C7A308B|nr:hypothetical protein [Psychroflexus sp. MES1-P1E]PKG43861.1 hypothetical protein CXF67_02775 [Psychroflexus sp. MES1-P1E]
MKCIKGIIFFVLIAIVIVFISAWVILKIDVRQTSYLKIENNADLKNNTYLIKNVNIIPITNDTVLRNKSVLIEKGLIKTISDTNAQDDIEVIDGKGGFLSPGLIDMHL